MTLAARWGGGCLEKKHYIKDVIHLTSLKNVPVLLPFLIISFQINVATNYNMHVVTHFDIKHIWVNVFTIFSYIPPRYSVSDQAPPLTGTSDFLPHCHFH